MVMQCAVMGCRSNSTADKVGYYTVPSIITRQDDETRRLSIRRRREWITRLGENIDENKVNSNTRVCGKHFVQGRPAKLREPENIDWLPTIGVHIDFNYIADDSSDEEDRLSIKRDISSHHTYKERTPKLEQESEDWLPVIGVHTEDGIADSFNDQDRILVKREISSPVLWHVDVEMHDHPQFEEEGKNRAFVNNSCQTDISSDDLIDKDFHYEVIADNVILRNENARLKASICEFSEEQLKGDDLKVKFYSGLHTFSTLKHVFELTSAKVKHTSSNILSKFQEFMVVMVRLRLNLLEHDLAFRFGVSQGTISNIMDRWLSAMSTSLRNLIQWPGRETLLKTMPECFKSAFENKVVVVIDSLTFSFERPSSLFPKAKKLSEYKNDKVKFLIGITPQDTVAFVSNKFVEQASDDKITEKCKILENLLPGDIVLADCEFTIEESVGLLYQTKFNIPAYIKGRSLTPSEEAQAEREKDNIKIHVEKLSGHVKHEFRILQSAIQPDYLNPRGDDSKCPLEHIVTICCALVNLCSTVVSLKPQSNHGS